MQSSARATKLENQPEGPSTQGGKTYRQTPTTREGGREDNQLQACITLRPKHYAQKVIHDIPMFTCNLTRQSCENGASEAGE